MLNTQDLELSYRGLIAVLQVMRIRGTETPHIAKSLAVLLLSLSHVGAAALKAIAMSL